MAAKAVCDTRLSSSQVAAQCLVKVDQDRITLKPMLLFEVNAERVLQEVLPVFGPRLASVHGVQWVSRCIVRGDWKQLLEIEL